MSERDEQGHFLPGHNSPGPGRPKGASLRRQFWQSMRDSDVRLAVLTLRRVMKSKSATNRDKLSAAIELLDRAVGTPTNTDLAERIAALEAAVASKDFVEKDDGR